MKRALVCIEQLQDSSFVFLFAKEFSERYRAEVCLLHVLEPSDGLTLPGVVPSPSLTTHGDDAMKALTEFMAQLPEGYRGNAVVEVGEPWRAICRCARAISADFIVIGAHRAHGLARMFGSTANLVVQKADRTVIVARPKPRE
jgi:nucleotide-binding universal stress UspA family protein